MDVQHRNGSVLPDRGDGLHWLRCTDCAAEWGERDDGSFGAGEMRCDTDAAACDQSARREGVIEGLERALGLMAAWNPQGAIRAELERLKAEG